MSEKQNNREALLALADRIQEADNKPIAINPVASDELRRLVAENEALRADAERYWWLLKNYLSFRLCDEALAHGSLDAAIDAERSKE